MLQALDIVRARRNKFIKRLLITSLTATMLKRMLLRIVITPQIVPSLPTTKHSLQAPWPGLIASLG